MIWWRDKGVKDEVKQARRAKRVVEGHQLEIGAQRAPRFLVYNISSTMSSTMLSTVSTMSSTMLSTMYTMLSTMSSTMSSIMLSTLLSTMSLRALKLRFVACEGSWVKNVTDGRTDGRTERRNSVL